MTLVCLMSWKLEFLSSLIQESHLATMWEKWAASHWQFQHDRLAHR